MTNISRFHFVLYAVMSAFISSLIYGIDHSLNERYAIEVCKEVLERINILWDNSSYGRRRSNGHEFYCASLDDRHSCRDQRLVDSLTQLSLTLGFILPLIPAMCIFPKLC